MTERIDVFELPPDVLEIQERGVQETLHIERDDVELLTEAVQGPPGPPGANGTGSTHTHTQSAAAAEWVINHNFGYRPSVTLYSTGGAEIEGEVLHTSVNQARAYFAVPVAGSARCI
jgi:hypothetical protein